MHALKSINLHSDSSFKAIRRGEFVMIRGPSGGGKTTFVSLSWNEDGGRMDTEEGTAQLDWHY